MNEKLKKKSWILSYLNIALFFLNVRFVRIFFKLYRLYGFFLNCTDCTDFFLNVWIVRIFFKCMDCTDLFVRIVWIFFLQKMYWLYRFVLKMYGIFVRIFLKKVLATLNMIFSEKYLCGIHTWRYNGLWHGYGHDKVREGGQE